MKTINHIVKYLREDHMRNCVSCGELKIRKYDGLDNRGRSVWRGEGSNNRWHASTCPKCYEVQRSRLKGHKSIDDIKNCTSAEGRRCEVLAKGYFESLGFKAKLNNVRGPDLVLTLGDIFFATCEVKKVTRGKWLNHEKWRVSAVVKNRINDDLICYVFEDGFYVTKMSTHLKFCSASGSRAIKVHERQALRGIKA